MFLSKLLTSIEKNYWSIELKIANLIWVIKKVRHLIQFSKKLVIIQINHEAIVNICKSTSIISTNSISRMNLRLMRTSQFFNQFSNLEIRHKSEKYHFISNVLFRFQSLNKKNLSDDHVKLNELFVKHNVVYSYNATLVKLNSEFRERIMNKYSQDDAWKKIIQTIDQNAALNENATKLSFIRESQMISRESDFYMISNINTSLNTLNFFRFRVSR
jgi:hypothetical protein